MLLVCTTCVPCVPQYREVTVFIPVYRTDSVHDQEEEGIRLMIEPPL